MVENCENISQLVKESLIEIETETEIEIKRKINKVN